MDIVSDIVYVVLTVAFFGLAWAFTLLCDRLLATGQSDGSFKN